MKIKYSGPRPTEGELEILRIIWEKGEASVKEIHESIAAYKKTGYTTIGSAAFHFRVRYGNGWGHCAGSPETYKISVAYFQCINQFCSYVFS